MNFTPVAITRSLLAAGLAVGLVCSAQAQEFPSREIRVVVPLAPGGGTDTITRQITDPLGKQLGIPVVVENRGGAGTLIGMDAVARADPDGYTLVVNGDTVAIFEYIFANLRFDVHQDFVPVSYFASAPIVLAAHPSLPADNVTELIELAQAAPGTIPYSTPGVGTPHDLAGLLMMQRAGIELNEISYRGNGQALIDLIAGHVSLGMFTISNVLPHLESGNLKVLAVVGDERTPVAPDIPSMAESGLSGVNVSSRYVILAPAGTPQSALQTLNASLRAIAAEPETATRFLSIGYEPMVTNLEEAATLLQEERERWAPVLAASDIQPQ
ncbi:MAG: Bug family tripartite tricarboxylate transporter substrate binding protein [Pigmentiphaga sp.]